MDKRVPERSRLSVYIAVFSLSVVTLAVKAFPDCRCFRGIVDRKSMGQTVADRSSNEADFLCILLYLAWRLWKSVVTLAVKGILFPVGFFRFHRAAGVSGASTAVDRKSMGHTMADRSSNEADFLCILLYLAWRLWKRVVTVAVKGNTISGRVFRRQGVPEFKRHRLPLTGSRWDKRWLIGRRTKPTFCVYCCI
jgi:hypothetical protein